MHTDQNQLKENRLHGTSDFPCAIYQCHSEYPVFYVPPHWHEEIEIIWIVRGGFHLEINMEHYESRGEAFFFINSGELHRLYSKKEGEPIEEYAIVFHPKILSFDSHDAAQIQILWPLSSRTLTLPRVIDQDHPLFSLIRMEYTQILDSISYGQGKPQSLKDRAVYGAAVQLCIKGSLIKILSFLSSHDLLQEYSDGDSRVDAVKMVLTYIREHYREKLSLGELAGVVNLNEQYFCRFFKHAVGKSPLRYVGEFRCHKAMGLLEQTSLTVMEICLETGYHNLGNFLREFRKQTGMTPLQYRKLSKKSI